MPRLNKLRRVDFSVHVYDRNAGYRESLLMFFEGKGQYARNDAKEAVEGQGFNACQTYVSSDRAASTTVNCLCVIGTIARAFQLLPGPIWRPFFGDDGEVNFSQYIDADDPQSKKIWSALNEMIASANINAARPVDM